MLRESAVCFLVFPYARISATEYTHNLYGLCLRSKPLNIAVAVKRFLWPKYYALKDKTKEQSRTIYQLQRRFVRRRAEGEEPFRSREGADAAISEPNKNIIEYCRRVWTKSNPYDFLGVPDELNLQKLVRRLPSETPVAQSRPRLLLLCRPGTTNFFDPVAASLREDFDILLAHNLRDAEIEKLGEGDVIWLEWGTSGVLLEQIPKTKAKIVIRLHDWEIREPYLLNGVDWARADHILFINRMAKEAFVSAVAQPELEDKIHVIPNVVDERQYPLIATDFEFRILMVCIKITPRKGIYRALEMFSALVRLEPRFRLTIRVTAQSDWNSFGDLLEDIAACGLEEFVTLSVSDGIMPYAVSELIHKQQIPAKVDVVAEYARHDIIWSPSYHEGFHYAVAEAALCGSIPVVIAWNWGDASQFWWPFLVDNEEDFVEKTLEVARLSAAERDEASQKAREHVIAHFGLDAGRRNILTVLEKQDQEPLPRRQRVVVFAHNHIYRNNPRGGERSTAAIIQRLIEKGYDVLVIVADRRQLGCLREETDGVTVINIDFKYYRVATIEIMRWWQPDVAIVWELPARDVWDICASADCPYLLFIRYWHLVAPQPYEDLLTQEIDRRFNRTVKPVFDVASSVITNCDHAGQVIERHFGVSTTTSYVPVFGTDVAPSKPESRRFITLINPKKTEGADDLVYAIAERMPDLEFLVIQGDPSRVRSKNVVHRDFSNQDYGEFFADTRVFLFPFKGEPCGTGRVVYECYSLGIPVIGSRKGGLPEVIPETHLVDDTDDVSSWVAAIRKVLENYSEEMQEAQSQWEDYDVERELNVVMTCVEKALQDRDTMKRAVKAIGSWPGVDIRHERYVNRSLNS